MIKLRQEASNCTTVILGDVTLYFSYETIVGFREDGHLAVFSENTWSRTTGKHLTSVFGSNKEDRLPHDEYEAKLHDMLKRHNLEG